MRHVMSKSLKGRTGGTRKVENVAKKDYRKSIKTLSSNEKPSRPPRQKRLNENNRLSYDKTTNKRKKNIMETYPKLMLGKDNK